jgi:cupin 2 domain-containing protein
MAILPNVFAGLPRALSGEVVTTLVADGCIRIERIVSHGQASPPGFWYDQDQHEWVAVLRGAAKIRFEGDEPLVEMHAGDFITIPAHRRHRVEWTTPDEPTVWLAVHFGE